MTIRSIEDVPGPRRLPVLGNAHQARSDRLHLVAERWCRQYGPMYRFDLGSRPIIAVGDAAIINDVLRRRPGEFRRWSEIEAMAIEDGSLGVFAAEGHDWTRQRRLAVTALNSNHLQRYFGVIRAACRRLLERLEASASDGGSLAIGDELKTFTLDVTTALAFGRDTLDDRDRDLRADIDRVFEMTSRRLAAPFPYWRWVRTPAFRALDQSRQRIRLAIGGYIADARARIQARPELREHPEDFLEGMLAAQQQDVRFNEQELFANTITMLLAGVDTTALTLAWTCWLLARHPDVQNRLADEAHALLGDDGVPVDYRTASDLAYAEAVFKEVLRLKPAAVFVAVEAINDTTAGEVSMPAGTRLLLLTRHAAQQHSAFARPDTFDPTRWVRQPEATHNPHAFLPFGAGPRFCPGRNLAFLEAKAALATLARNFQMSIDPNDKPVTERLAFTMAPHGLKLRLKARPSDGANGSAGVATRCGTISAVTTT